MTFQLIKRKFVHIQLTDSTARHCEISQRLFGKALYLFQLIHTIEASEPVAIPCYLACIVSSYARNLAKSSGICRVQRQFFIGLQLYGILYGIAFRYPFFGCKQCSRQIIGTDMDIRLHGFVLFLRKTVKTGKVCRATIHPTCRTIFINIAYLPRS